MRIQVKISPSCKETEVMIVAPEMTDEVNALVQRISAEFPEVVAGYRGDRVELLDWERVVRFYASDGKVYAETERETYTVKLRLYEIEERLTRPFVRISNSEIVNLKQVKSFDFGITGTILVVLKNGKSTYASRRYVSKIKKVLGL